MNERITVLVVDDHSVVRGGLRLFLLAFPDLELIGEAGSGEEAVQFCAIRRPDVVLMDLMMPGMSGVEATRGVRRVSPQTQVIALTSFLDHQLVQDVLEAGAIGYMLKSAQAAELAEAIRAARSGKATLAGEAGTSLIHQKGGTPVQQELTEVLEEEGASGTDDDCVIGQGEVEGNDRLQGGGAVSGVGMKVGEAGRGHRSDRPGIGLARRSEEVLVEMEVGLARVIVGGHPVARSDNACGALEHGSLLLSARR